MKKKILVFFTITLLCVLNASAQETFKVMFYNLLNYPLEDAVPNREDDLEFILSDYQPDLFLVCELNNIAGANNVLGITRTFINSNFEMATYVSNTSDDTTGDQNDLQNLLYYDSTKFIIEEEIIVPTYLRDFNLYKLKLNTIDQDTNPVVFYVVICHLKASSGTTNAQRRFEMVQDLDTYLNTLPADTNVLLGGDLNLYTASESAFQELLDSSNNITFADPANRIGSWNNNTSFVDVFTQSTRTQTGLGGSTGGFDDRFDFILTSENMISTANITYVPDSYQVYGNNGLVSCYNSRINSTNCGNSTSQFSFDIRDALHNFSDHLPVTVLLETDASLLNITDTEIASYFKLKNSITDYYLNIYVNSSQLFNEYLNIYNSLGQKVKSLQLNSENDQQFDVSDLQSGLYYLTSPNQQIKSLKFLISN
ncbi:T9SS type A sorting domain-containing protein [uncultured Winogradskyella sp.]|uniref:T9SS type A sorting domain-containing protein n=1 Tax=uncultured Winogradskyella sp. TaxID=395353 RepID=UPI0026204A78|nr:T9SS type A sorting domain-containing protein [uncultured Winogradskyella sp.]